MFLKKIADFLSKMSLRLRLTLLFVVIFGVTTIIFNIVVYQFTIQTLQKDFDDALFNYAVDVSESIELGPKGDLNLPLLKLDHGKVLPFALGTALILVRHSSGQVLAQVGNFGKFDPPYKKDFQTLSMGEEAHYRTISNVDGIPAAEADEYRMISFPLDSSPTPQVILQVAAPMTLLETQISNRLTILEIGIPLVLLIATLGGWFLSVRAMAPVNHMIQTAQEIDAEVLSQRVPVPAANDEIKKLALTLNEMLGRIEKAFASQERFVADASHQLLTPLTIMKGELEMLNKSEKKSEEIESYIKSTLQEVDSLTRIIQDMLLLARIDAGIGALNLQNIYLDELVMETLSRTEKLARAKKIKLKVDIQSNDSERKIIRGDYDLLTNLVLNIVENAIKYSPEEETVNVLIKWKEKVTQLIVEDRGPGIPEDQLSQIFERFSRGQGADKKTKGFGLGLAIAHKISIAHDAKISAENLSGSGARFCFEIKNI